MNYNIGVVLVTFNRIEKLKIALKCFSNQIEKPAYVIVVDNASSDGTNEFLSKWKMEKEQFEKEFVSLKVNSGGSGGFYEGIRIALNKDADWIWVSDDDAFPEQDCLMVAKQFIASKNDSDSYSALCGAVYNRGEINVMHRRRTFHKGVKYYSIPVGVDEYSREFFCNTFSYVGSILNRTKLEIVGLPQKNYFIWNDDTEHSLRMSKVGKIVCLPQMKINHDEMADSTSFSWKSYYGTRNRLDMMRRNFPSYFFVYQWLKFAFFAFRRFILNREEGFLYFSAVKDALLRNYGLHKKYRPGWKPRCN